MGGVLRSLETARRAAQAQIGLVVGAQVGETSVLTRAGLTVAHAARPNLLAQEGAFGTHLLERDVVAQPIVFGAGGWLDADALPRAAGWGLEIVLT
jgi:muconate cycloisomerase